MTERSVHSANGNSNVNGAPQAPLNTTRPRTRRAFLAGVAALALAGCSADSIGGGILRDFPPPADKRTNITFYLEPFEGIPGNEADLLAEKIQLYGVQHRLGFIQSPERPDTTYRVIGRLAITANAAAAAIFFTFEVIDRQNQIVYRIRDQQPVLVGTGSALDPWSLVKDGHRAFIASKFVSRLQSWLSRAPR